MARINPQAVRVSRLIIYRAKKTTKKYRKGQQVSQAYAKRYRKLVRREEWQTFAQQKVRWDPKTKTQTLGDWKVTSRVKLVKEEKILSLRQFTQGSVEQTFARQKVYQKLWENDRGDIRVTVNGMVEGKRVREVVHLGFLKSAWKHQHNGYEKFKRFLVGSVLSNLRQRGVRLSDPRHSQERIERLRQRLVTESAAMERLPDWLHGAQANKVKAIARDIQKQKRSRQLRGATIRIEKLV